MGREGHSGRRGRVGCLPADVGVAPVPAGLSRKQQGGGESGQTSLLPGSDSGSLALQLGGHFPLGSCTPAGSGQISPAQGMASDSYAFVVTHRPVLLPSPCKIVSLHLSHSV